MTYQAEAPNGARTEAEREHIERRLDEAIEESFPASDPPAVGLRDDPPVQPHEVEDEQFHSSGTEATGQARARRRRSGGSRGVRDMHAPAPLREAAR